MAAKLQIESERNFVRSFVYHQVQASMRPPPGADDEIEKLKADIQQFEVLFAAKPLPALENVLTERRQKLSSLASGSTDGIAWPELVNRFAGRIEVAEWIKGVWQARDKNLFTDESRIAEFLLLREFARRPKRANSTETLGIARLRNPSIERLTDSQLPGAFRRKGKTLDDWRTYLDAVLTWFVRANGAVAISWQMQHWVLSKAKLTSLVGPDSQTNDDAKLRAWPNGYFRATRVHAPSLSFFKASGSISTTRATDAISTSACARHGPRCKPLSLPIQNGVRSISPRPSSRPSSARSIARSHAAFSTARRSALRHMESRNRARRAGAPFRSPCRDIPPRSWGSPTRPTRGRQPTHGSKRTLRSPV
jgi:hypothetical protein